MDEDFIISDLAAKCSYAHLEICNCQQNVVNQYQKEELDLIKENLKESKKNNDAYNFILIKNNALNKGIKRASDELLSNNVICPIEIDIIKRTLSKFSKTYDLNDVKVFMIVKSVINMQLSSHRMQLYANKHGAVQEDIKDGKRYYRLNPVEDAKRKADESIVYAIKELNAIIVGSKVNIEHSGNLIIEDIKKYFDAAPPK